MPIHLDSSALRQTKPREYAMRFLFGGLCTALTGLIAEKWGPVVGGLFLAFPAILPAGATLIDKHAREKKQKKGLQGTVRGRREASLDAAGAAMGSIGLFAFALAVRLLLPSRKAPLVLASATLLWLTISFGVWRIRKRM
jgi:hypothetical protein